MTRFINTTKTAVLMGAMFGLVLAAGYIFGQGQGLLIAFFLGGAMNLVAFFFSDRIAIKSMRGREVDASTAPDLIEMVSRLARNADLPMPKVYVCPQQAPNAFATGRSPKKAAVAVTQGALQILSYDELEGVMAHELAHVKNRDTLTSTIAATIAGAISALGWVFMFGGGNRDVHPLVALVFVLVAPIAAGIIQMAISRSREFVADHDGAEIAGSPRGLISALQKLEMQAQRIPLANENPAQNHMFIVAPLNAVGGGGKGLADLFRTHPRTEQRIAKLREMA
ncbi:MAG: zinc metalloprotease HtpX [Planctomycetota bacterium]